ncbi:TPA: hypothetical protein ACOTHO_002503 [Clostridium perfringens]|nr:hypothetical protein [Clostridium perfringens]MDK0719475.1 hypothetical protein [Clostridium perfringens]MDK0859137.1 hypothetical protein [Clostridium perfringens]MDM0581954.1 hypothetical protein [Clostridium perfringens]MDM0588279.1 hypothetical protein [Clostridium perfringens]
MLDNLALVLANKVLEFYWQGLSFKDALKKVKEENKNILDWSRDIYVSKM